MANDKDVQAAWHAKNPGKAAQYRNKTRQRYAENPDIRRCQNLRSRYGISLDQMMQLLAKQEGRCAICGSVEPKGRWNRWHVDHNHATGEVRGILCHPCNVGLGAFSDSADTMAKAVVYLKR